MTFNCAESVQRCLDDYHGSASWLRHRYQPTPLRFRERYRLVVTPAPDPVDILWENMDVTGRQKRARALCVNILLFLCLVASAVVCVVTQNHAAAYSAQVPRSDTCTVDVPVTWLRSTAFPDDVQLARVASSDAACPDGGSLFTLTSAAFGEPWQWTGEVDGAIDGTVPPCALNATCISLDTGDVCPVPLVGGSATLSLSSVAACYCAAAMQRSWGWVVLLVMGADRGYCSGYYLNAVLAEVMSILPGVAVVVVNVVMTRLVRALASFERHLTISRSWYNLSTKLFVAQLVNTALVIQVFRIKFRDRCVTGAVLCVLRRRLHGHVHMWHVCRRCRRCSRCRQSEWAWLLLLIVCFPRCCSLPFPVSGALVGKASLFGLDWYTGVGVSVVATMVSGMVVPVAISIVSACSRRCQKWHALKRYSSQAQVDVVFRPPAFDVGGRTATMLTTAFVCFIFSSALPALLPIACVTFTVQYWRDKVRAVLRGGFHRATCGWMMTAPCRV